jgi:ribosomal protein L11 methyltransferase
MSFQRFEFALPAEYEEPFTAELWTRGILGCELRDAEPGWLRIVAWFPDPLPTTVDAQGGWLAEERWEEHGVRQLSCSASEEQDWLAGYRAEAAPVEVGRRFRIDPRDLAEIDADLPEEDRITLHIPAQTAFGTGSHESTRLAIRWLEELDLADLTVLDVGTGSGILAFVAEHCGARRVVGFDLDAQAVCIARANARWNGLHPHLFAGRLAALRAAPHFDLALVNILPERILDEIPTLLRVLRPRSSRGMRARVISSGNLVERRDELLARFAVHGLHSVGELVENEWMSFLLTWDGGG